MVLPAFLFCDAGRVSRFGSETHILYKPVPWHLLAYTGLLARPSMHSVYTAAVQLQCNSESPYSNVRLCNISVRISWLWLNLVLLYTSGGLHKANAHRACPAFNDIYTQE